MQQFDVARAQGISSALLCRWQRIGLEQALLGSAEREEIKLYRSLSEPLVRAMFITDVTQ